MTISKLLRQRIFFLAALILVGSISIAQDGDVFSTNTGTGNEGSNIQNGTGGGINSIPWEAVGAGIGAFTGHRDRATRSGRIVDVDPRPDRCTETMKYLKAMEPYDFVAGAQIGKPLGDKNFSDVYEKCVVNPCSPGGVICTRRKTTPNYVVAQGDPTSPYQGQVDHSGFYTRPPDDPGYRRPPFGSGVASYGSNGQPINLPPAPQRGKVASTGKKLQPQPSSQKKHVWHGALKFPEPVDPQHIKDPKKSPVYPQATNEYQKERVDIIVDLADSHQHGDDIDAPLPKNPNGHQHDYFKIHGTFVKDGSGVYLKVLHLLDRYNQLHTYPNGMLIPLTYQEVKL